MSIAKGILDYGEAVKEERLAGEERELLLLQLGYEAQKTKSKYTSGGEYTKAAEGTMNLKNLISNSSEDLDEETMDFFQNLFEDPLAASKVYNFIEKSATGDSGIIVPLSEVKNMVMIYNSPVPKEEKIDLVSDITGVDFRGSKGKKRFNDLYKKIADISDTPQRTVYATIKPEAQVNLQAREKRFDIQNNHIDIIVASKAMGEINKLIDAGDPEAKIKAGKIDTALKNLKNKESIVVAQAREELYDMFLTQELFANVIKSDPILFQDYKDNPSIRNRTPQGNLLDSETPSEVRKNKQTFNTMTDEDKKMAYDLIVKKGGINDFTRDEVEKEFNDVTIEDIVKYGETLKKKEEAKAKTEEYISDESKFHQRLAGEA
tara:strand:- start:46 stop:1173 length:1128 start_codon:yes stop_codon:yes gene_type:complete